MIIPSPASPEDRACGSVTAKGRRKAVAVYASKLSILAGLVLFVYGLAWNFSTRTYLKGFAEAIIPLDGSPQEKTEALIGWFHHEPQRNATLSSESVRLLEDRDPVNIVQNIRLLKVCGTASNAFMNLAVAAGLNVRRLLLLDRSGNTMHVVAEVQWGDRWIVVNPQQGLIYKDQLGRALTKEELHNTEVFRDAISRMPGYDPEYTFDRTIHVHLERIPVLGGPLRVVLDRLVPGWEESINWSYFPENPSLWLIVISLTLLLLGIASNLFVKRHTCDRPDKNTFESHSL